MYLNMHFLTLVPFASLALSIPYPHPEETGFPGSGPAPAHAPMAQRLRDAIQDMPIPHERDAPELEARQQGQGVDFGPLITLASLAGIPLPTDPAALFSLAPLASHLLQALPTSPVLAALETAAPSGFISKIVHDPSFAASFESAFAEGSSPSWFLALPTSVREYLHTYQGIETVAGELGPVVASVTKIEASEASTAASGAGNATHTGTNSTITNSGASQTGGIVATGSATQTPTSANSVSSASSAGAAARVTAGGSFVGDAGHGGLLGSAVAAGIMVLGAAMAL